MPIRQLILLLAFFASCLAIVGLAWATGSELYFWIPNIGRWHAWLPLRRPPTHPGVILGLLALSLPLTYWFRQNGVYFFVFATICLLLGSAVGFFVFQWNPTWTQHLLAAVMIATSVYAWKQKSYFED